MLLGFSQGKLFNGEQTWAIGAFDAAAPRPSSCSGCLLSGVSTTTARSPPGFDGGAPVIATSGGWWGFVTATATASGERLEELLRVMDYFAAPFGSIEYTFLNYGIEGRHFTFDGSGNPPPTSDQAALTEMNGNYFLIPTRRDFTSKAGPMPRPPRRPSRSSSSSTPSPIRR